MYASVYCKIVYTNTQETKIQQMWYNSVEVTLPIGFKDNLGMSSSTVSRQDTSTSLSSSVAAWLSQSVVNKKKILKFIESFI